MSSPWGGSPSAPTSISSVVAARAGGVTPATRASPPSSAHPAASREGPRIASVVLADSPVRLVMASPDGAPPASREGGERRSSPEGGQGAAAFSTMAYPFEPDMLFGPGAGPEGWRHEERDRRDGAMTDFPRSLPAFERR